MDIVKVLIGIAILVVGWIAGGLSYAMGHDEAVIGDLIYDNDEKQNPSAFVRISNPDKLRMVQNHNYAVLRVVNRLDKDKSDEE